MDGEDREVRTLLGQSSHLALMGAWPCLRSNHRLSRSWHEPRGAAPLLGLVTSCFQL